MVPVAYAGGQRVLQTVLQQAPVRQVGQRVVKRQPPDFLLGVLARGDIARHHHKPRRSHCANRFASDRQLEPAPPVLQVQ